MKELLAYVASLALGGTFLTSGLSKLRDPSGFVLGVLDYKVLPPKLGVLYAGIVPIVEVMAGLGLVVGIWPKVVGLLSAALLFSFLVAVSINLVRGRRIDCHCFGSRQSEPLGGVTVARISALLLCALVVMSRRGGAFPVRAPLDLLPMLMLASALIIGLYLLRAIGERGCVCLRRWLCAWGVVRCGTSFPRAAAEKEMVGWEYMVHGMDLCAPRYSVAHSHCSLWSDAWQNALSLRLEQ